MNRRPLSIVGARRVGADLPATFHIVDGVLAGEPGPGAGVLEADGLMLAPGYVDLQINGGFGYDFTADPTTIWQVGTRLVELGVTTFLPTVISARPEVPAAALDVLRNGEPDGYRGAVAVGLHIEGPMISPDNRGTHPLRHLTAASLDRIVGWTREAGVVMVTLAPELPGALSVIERLAADGVVVSAGHSTATLEQAQAGIAAGVTHGTHLFNAMPPLDHQAPGLAGALLASRSATVGLILDGIHVAPEVVGIVWRAMGPDRMIPVTDAMAGMGMPPGDYPLGDVLVTVTETDARNQQGGLAGANLRMDQAVRNLVSFTGCTAAEATHAAGNAARRVLGVPPAGSASGEHADLVLLNEHLDVIATIVGGELMYG